MEIIAKLNEAEITEIIDELKKLNTDEATKVIEAIGGGNRDGF